MIQKYALLSLLFVLHGVSAMCCGPAQKPNERGALNPYSRLYNTACAAARKMCALQKREEIEKLIRQKLRQYKTDDQKQVVLNYWLEYVLNSNKFGKKEILQAETLLAQGADPNAETCVLARIYPPGKGRPTTLLMDNALSGRLKSVEFLLDHGADPLRYNRNGESALHLAAGKSNQKNACALIDLILEKDVSVDYPTSAPDPDGAESFYAGKTALWDAIECACPASTVVRKLLKRGAQPNGQQPKTKELPLDYVLKAMGNRSEEPGAVQKYGDIAQALYCHGQILFYYLQKKEKNLKKCEKTLHLTEIGQTKITAICVRTIQRKNAANNNHLTICVRKQ